ncbi:hypothetical protein IWQ60_011219 [Tieghemiomyces parasiticus]|uniref:Elongation factor P n=1 Tax=Tieghemiomyces parasiticus TaxID=78921 RepID=A0A9W7ZHN3_9FUNG|nr:hypothetical protein IWQ60_011219 [Tieghemiomyces parasiticus]
MASFFLTHFRRALAASPQPAPQTTPGLRLAQTLRTYRTASGSLRAGNVIEYASAPWVVVRRELGGTGRGVGLVKMELRNAVTGQKKVERCKSDTEFEVLHLKSRPHEFLYTVDSTLHLMNPASLEEIEISADMLSGGPDMAKLVQDGMTLQVQSLEDDVPLLVHLPKSATYTVANVTPKASRAKGANLCPAELDNGVKVTVPDFVHPGDQVVIDLETRKYIARA